MKKYLTLLALCLCGASGGSWAEEELIDENDLLEFLYDSFKTCNGVTKVDREDSDFRVLHDTNIRLEFSLKDMNIPKGASNDYLQLKCGPPGCVAQYVGVAGQWKESQPNNSAIFQCDENLVRRMKTVVRYYKKHYSE
jgi:hypothetical protein